MLTILVAAMVTLGGCSTGSGTSAPLPTWSFDPAMIFPADGSLARPEDGVMLPNGRLIVADQVSGLRLVRPDGSSRPFGRFAEAGYRHEPPTIVGAPNGVSLEPDGAHILVADVYRGGIYRVNGATEATERVYQHPFGVNTAIADQAGGIWFTQSTRNAPEHGEEDLFRSVAFPVADGALFHLPPAPAGAARAAVRIADDFAFANGLALDESSGHLYVAETMANRVWRFRVNVATGRVTEREVALTVDHPDNLEFDRQGRLWIACPIRTEVVVFDPDTTTTTPVFRIATPTSEATLAEIEARSAAGDSWLDLMAPPLWEPAPGLLTGLILAPDDGTVYLTGLGNAMIRLKW